MENGAITQELVESSCRLGTGSGELCLLVDLVGVDEGKLALTDGQVGPLTQLTLIRFLSLPLSRGKR